MVGVLSRTKNLNRERLGYLGGFDKSYSLEGIGKLKDRWTRVELNLPTKDFVCKI